MDLDVIYRVGCDNGAFETWSNILAFNEFTAIYHFLWLIYLKEKEGIYLNHRCPVIEIKTNMLTEISKVKDVDLAV